MPMSVSNDIISSGAGNSITLDTRLSAGVISSSTPNARRSSCTTCSPDRPPEYLPTMSPIGAMSNRPSSLYGSIVSRSRQVTSNHLSMSERPLYSSVSPTPSLTILLSLVRRSITGLSTRGMSPVRLSHILYPSTGTVLAVSWQQLHMMVSGEMLNRIMMLGYSDVKSTSSTWSNAPTRGS